MRGGFIAALAAAVAASACGGGHSSVTGPTPTPTKSDSTTSFPGFDIGIYPGDAAMSAWRYPSSPYRWVGYYLAAPCHRDVTFTGKYSTLTSQGWGLAALYVGQQDWTQISSAIAASRAEEASQQLVTCSASLLTAAQGGIEATDAATRMQSEGFPAGSVVYLDVEYVQSVTPALLEYVRGWITGLVRDGRYRPGVYAARTNASTLRAAVLAAVQASGSAETPPFWITSSGSFSLTATPQAVGLDFAKLWQGTYDVAQTWNGVTLRIDQNVAAMRSPSTP